MNVSSTIKLNFGKIKELNQAAVTTLKQTAEYLHDEVQQAQVVPRMDGALSEEEYHVDESESHNGKVTLVHATAYARRMYYHPEYHFMKGPWEEKITKNGVTRIVSHEGNPNAQGEWYKDWLPGGGKENACKEAFERLYRRNAGV